MPGVWAEDVSEGPKVQPREVLHRAGTRGAARDHSDPEAKNQERRAPKRADKPTGEKSKA